MPTSSSLEAIYARALRPYDGPLAAELLTAEAQAATGLSDWGGERWAEDRFHRRLAALCASLENEAGLTALGRTRAHTRVHIALCARLRTIDWRRGWSGERPIAAPLIGTGFPRAGTSFLHQLLAQDPDNLSASTAECGAPIPPPGDPAVDAERNALMDRLLDFQGLYRPEVDAVHPFAPDAPDEDVAMQESACGTPFQAFFDVPGYMAAVFADVDDLFDWQKGVMQVLQSGRTGGRWVLKTPEHMHNWEALHRAFPDGRVFLNHRDPGKVIASIASLFVTFRRLNSDAVPDPKHLGPPMLERLTATMDKVTAWRAAHPEVKVVDVHYKALVADPIAEAERVYAAFGLTLSPKARQRMSDFLKVNRHGHGAAPHRYALADFGLTEAAIEAVCGRYIDQFGVAREKRE
jgi:hypothetical protein